MTQNKHKKLRTNHIFVCTVLFELEHSWRWTFFFLSAVCIRFKQQNEDGQLSLSATQIYRKQQCQAKLETPLCLDDDWVRSIQAHKYKSIDEYYKENYLLVYIIITSGCENNLSFLSLNKKKKSRKGGGKPERKRALGLGFGVQYSWPPHVSFSQWWPAILKEVTMLENQQTSIYWLAQSHKPIGRKSPYTNNHL